MKVRCSLCGFVGLLFALLVHAGEASSLTITPNPVNLSIGELHLVGVATGLPVGGVIHFGSVGSDDTTLLFQASFTASASDLTFVGPIFFTTSFGGGGTIPGPNFDVTVLSPSFGVAQIQEVIPARVTTDIFFLSLSPFQIGDGVSVRLQSPGRLVASGFTIVPEPSTALLLATGLCGLQLAYRRASHRPTARDNRLASCERGRPTRRWSRPAATGGARMLRAAGRRQLLAARRPPGEANRCAGGWQLIAKTLARCKSGAARPQ